MVKAKLRQLRQERDNGSRPARPKHDKNKIGTDVAYRKITAMGYRGRSGRPSRPSRRCRTPGGWAAVPAWIPEPMWPQGEGAK